MPKFINAGKFAVINSIDLEKEKGEINAIISVYGENFIPENTYDEKKATHNNKDIYNQRKKECKQHIADYQGKAVGVDAARNIRYRFNGIDNLANVIVALEKEANEHEPFQDHSFFQIIKSNLISFADFPEEVILNILQFISEDKDLATIGRVNKEWNKWSQDNSIWLPKLDKVSFVTPTQGEVKNIYRFFKKALKELNANFFTTNKLQDILSIDEIIKIIKLLLPHKCGDLSGIIMADNGNEFCNNQSLWKNRKDFTINYTSYTCFQGDFATYQKCLNHNPNLYYLILAANENQIISKLYENFSQFVATHWVCTIHKNATNGCFHIDIATTPPVAEQVSETPTLS